MTTQCSNSLIAVLSNIYTLKLFNSELIDECFFDLSI